MNSHMLFFLKIFMDFEMYSLFLYCITNSCDLGFYKCLLFMSGEGGAFRQSVFVDEQLH